MIVKKFKKFLKENILEDSFNNFVEQSITSPIIDKDKATQFLSNPEYLYSGEVYRLLWVPNQEISNQENFKNIARFISSHYLNDPNSYKFFYKTEDEVVASKLYAKNVEDKTGIIFTLNAKDAIDFSKYTGNNDSVKERLTTAAPVLYFEPLNIDTIFGKLSYDQYTQTGWVLDTNETNDSEDTKEIKDKKDHEIKLNKEKPVSGISKGKKHSLYPHSKES